MRRLAALTVARCAHLEVYHGPRTALLSASLIRPISNDSSLTDVRLVEKLANSGGREPPPVPLTEWHDSAREEHEILSEDDFDELEAASQELHDLCYAMIAHLRITDPEATRALFERRVKKAFREPKPERYRRQLHGNGDRALERRNNYRSRRDFVAADKLYNQWGEKLLLLLTQPVLDRLLKSAGKGFLDLRSDGVHRYRRHMEKASWRSFPHRWFKHAPFEVQQLRADMPMNAVLNTRFYRDHATLRYLFTLMEPQHAFREKLEQRMLVLTTKYDPIASKSQERAGE